MASGKEYFSVTLGEDKRSPYGNLVAQMKNFRKEVKGITGHYLDTIATIFVERAREKLGNVYPSATRFASQISHQMDAGRGSVQVRFYGGDDLPIMYYLEFGTGIVGETYSHEGLDNGFLNIQWSYGINKEKFYPVGAWWKLVRDGKGKIDRFNTKGIGHYRDKNGRYHWEFIPKGKGFSGLSDNENGTRGWVYGIVKTEPRIVLYTSGLVPTQYLYDTYLELDQIKEEAMRRIKNEQTLPRRRIVRK